MDASNACRIVAMVVGFCWVLLFLFVPETFWDRTPRPKSRHASKNNSRLSLFRQKMTSHVSNHLHPQLKRAPASNQVDGSGDAYVEKPPTAHSAAEPALRRPSEVHRNRGLHVGFAPEDNSLSDKTVVNESLDGHDSPPNGRADPVAAMGMNPEITIAEGKNSNNLFRKMTLLILCFSSNVTGSWRYWPWRSLSYAKPTHSNFTLL